jgi:Rad52/22 family double-strand break repair protein
MSGANGHAQDVAEPILPAGMIATGGPRFSPQQIKELVAALEVPFDPSQIEWRVMNTTKSQPLRGQVVPYADQRAYTDRLNTLFTPAGWTRKYAIHTSANFERTSDQKIVAKVLVTCELTIFGLGSHSATGEEWADDSNAGTSAEPIRADCLKPSQRGLCLRQFLPSKATAKLGEFLEAGSHSRSNRAWRYRPARPFLSSGFTGSNRRSRRAGFSTSSFCQPGDGVQKLLWWTISVLVNVVADESRSGVQLAVPTWNTYFCIA